MSYYDPVSGEMAEFDPYGIFIAPGFPPDEPYPGETMRLCHDCDTAWLNDPECFNCGQPAPPVTAGELTLKGVLNLRSFVFSNHGKISDKAHRPCLCAHHLFSVEDCNREDPVKLSDIKVYARPFCG